jgi:uncharacterized protein YndB with AHSA1/START domain
MPASLESAVRKSVRVNVPVERAFRVFVEHMEMWWPTSHHIGKTPFKAIFVEPRIGGKWYEINARDEKCEWGTVLKWEPPHVVTFSWHLGPGHDQPDWLFDPDMSRASEVEVRFRPEAPNTTLVELTHSRLERHGEGHEQLRALFDGPTAWAGILNLYALRTNAITAGTPESSTAAKESA